MKKNMKYFLLGLSTTLMLPIITNAATMKISGNDSDSNVAKYDLMYTGAEGEDTTLNLAIMFLRHLKNADWKGSVTGHMRFFGNILRKSHCFH